MEAEEKSTLRDALVAGFDAMDNTFDDAPSASTTAVPESSESAAAVVEQPRHEDGRFAEKQSAGAAQAAPEQPQEQPQLQRPSTWKKDYLPIWDKLANGAQLTPEEARKLAEYSNQREREYATGVSTYKAEAQNARELQGALEPFLPALQQHGIKPTEWIRNLGSAHQVLAQGTPQQKLQAFAKLAQDYGVPIQAVQQAQQGQIDPVAQQLMQHIQNLTGRVQSVDSWREQQEQKAIQQQIARFQDAEKYPHFEQVRQTMAQILEAGLTQDLDDAYAKAVRMNDEVWNAEQERQAQAAASKQAQEKATAAARAKAKAVSPRSTTPAGTVKSADAKDRRALLSEQLDAMAGDRV